MPNNTLKQFLNSQLLLEVYNDIAWLLDGLQLFAFYLAFNKASGFPLLSQRAAFLLEVKLPALNDHFNVWV